MLRRSVVLLISCSFALAIDRPILGVLFQEPSYTLRKLLPDSSAYLPASYVRAVEASGARVVPIHLNQSRTYYQSIVKSVNGVILPGGNTWFYGHEGGYADSGDLLMEEVRALNDRGVNFPVIGICLGFELLLFLDYNRTEYRTFCSATNVSLNLDFKPNFAESRLFNGASNDLINILSEEPVTFNEHRFCVTEQNLTELGLDSLWNVLSTSVDPVTGLTFISSIESKAYPFIGLQFHPEKNPFEWKRSLNIPRSPNSIRASRFFFDWLVSEAKLNNNSFTSKEEEYNSLIYNYPTYFSREVLSFDEVYLQTDERSGSRGILASSASIWIYSLFPILCMLL